MRRRIPIDAGLTARVQALLTSRDETRRPAERPELKVTAQADGATEILLYDEISYWGVTATDFAAVMAGISGPINLRVSSPGGDVFDALAIYNMLLDHDGPVTVTIDGLAASAASFIAMAGDRVIANRGASVMIHDASGLCIGNAAEMTAMAALLDMVSGTIADIYAARTGTGADVWRERMRAESWFTSEEAVAAGLVDEQVPHPRRDGEDEEREPDYAARLCERLAVALFPYRPAAVLQPEVGEREPAPTDQAPAPVPDPQPVAPLSTGEGPAPEPSDPPPDDEGDHGQPDPAGRRVEDEWAADSAHLLDETPTDSWERLREGLL